MFEIAVIVMQWLHVLGGIFWFGGTLTLNFIVIPSILGLPIDQRPGISSRIGKQMARVIEPVAGLVIILGLLRGTAFGAVQSLSIAFGTIYGRTFVTAFVVATATFLWGKFMLGPTAERLNVVPKSAEEWVTFKAATNRVKTLALLELIGFFAIFTCMILMRFGY